MLSRLLERARERSQAKEAQVWRARTAPGGLFAYASLGGPGVRGMPVAAVDLETTGLDGNVDRIVEIGIVRVEPDGRRHEYATLVNPDRDTGPAFIHGIENSDVAHAPRFGAIAGDVLTMLDGAVVVAHNASFEERFLVGELRRAGVGCEPLPAVCTLEMARHGLPSLYNHKLGSVALACGSSLEGAHTALGDARAVAAMFPTLAARVPLALPIQPVLRGYRGFGTRPVNRTGRIAKGDGWVSSLIERLPLTTTDVDPVEVDAYIDALTAALADGKLVREEALVLASMAGRAGLGQERLRALHTRYLDACRAAALEDDVLTAAELKQLNRLAALLGEEHYFADLSVTAPTARANVGGRRVWLSPQVDGALVAAVTARGFHVAKNITKTCLASVVDPADHEHAGVARSHALRIPVLLPDAAWSELELHRTGEVGETLSGIATTASAVASEGWFPDPRGRWPMRWWNGSAWTEFVCVAGSGETERDPI